MCAGRFNAEVHNRVVVGIAIVISVVVGDSRGLVGVKGLQHLSKNGDMRAALQAAQELRFVLIEPLREGALHFQDEGLSAPFFFRLQTH